MKAYPETQCNAHYHHFPVSLFYIIGWRCIAEEFSLLSASNKKPGLLVRLRLTNPIDRGVSASFAV
jgi:hypothetical protein